MKKKSLFIVIESLIAAGAEKSLISFLSVLDYSRFEVDLQLFRYGGEFERFIPKEVHLLPPFEYTKFLEKGFLSQIISFDFKKIWARLMYSIAIRKGTTYHVDKARLYYKYVFPCLSKNPKKYDVAIGYAQGLPTFYVADKVSANIRFSWVNASYRLEGLNKMFQRQFYKNINHIILVSDSACNLFKEVYPEFAYKMSVIWDIQNAAFIQQMSLESPQWNMDKDIPCF